MTVSIVNLFHPDKLLLIAELPPILASQTRLWSLKEGSRKTFTGSCTDYFPELYQVVKTINNNLFRFRNYDTDVEIFRFNSISACALLII